MRYIVGVDIGGTFTDCVARDSAGGGKGGVAVEIGKALSTPPDFETGFIAALQVAADMHGSSGTSSRRPRISRCRSSSARTIAIGSSVRGSSTASPAAPARVRSATASIRAGRTRHRAHQRAPDPALFVDDTMVLRRFCCPGCKTQTATEIARADEAIFPEMRLIG